MQARSGTLTFKMGDAFPADNPLAVFVVALSTAFNDLLMTNTRLLGRDASGRRVRTSQAERLSLLRLSFSQLFELRGTIENGQRNPAIEAFLGGLPDSAKQDLERVLRRSPPGAPWVADVVEYVRNRTFHYATKDKDWEPLQWATWATADHDGGIEMANSLVSGLRLTFADLIAVQHLLRKSPELSATAVGDPIATDQSVQRERLATLFSATAEATDAALDFCQAVVDTYLTALPPGTLNTKGVRWRRWPVWLTPGWWRLRWGRR